MHSIVTAQLLIRYSW